MPASPLRSGTVPSAAAIAEIVSAKAASAVDLAVTTPSPLNGWALKTSVMPITSASASVAASDLPARASRFLKDLRSAWPSGVSSFSSPSGISALPAKRKSSFLKRAAIQSTAASTSGTRTRPSPSASSSFSVAASKRTPVVGAASTVHSFLSSSLSASRSSPVSTFACTQRADLKNCHLCIVCSIVCSFLSLDRVCHLFHLCQARLQRFQRRRFPVCRIEELQR